MNPLLFLTPLLNIGKGWIEHRSKMKEVTRTSEIKIAEAKSTAAFQRIANGDAHAARLDEVSITTRGWKDEYLLLLVTVPVIMSFIPEYQPYAVEGFAALATLPEWYMWVLLGVYIDTFGFRRMLRIAMEQYVSKRFGS